MEKNNSGDWNSGDWNSGNRNSGNKNSGDWNSGNRNSGNGNSGNWNSGIVNSGNRNSGDWNSGNKNSGDWNSGNRNSGIVNSGNRNSGSRNSGNGNSGDWNSGNRNSGYFNTNEPNIRIFNKETNLKRKDIKLPFFTLKINEWIPEEKMTGEQKLKDKYFHIKQGTLITRTYKEAWKLYWSEASKEDKQMFLNLPNFDGKIFKEITGIDIEEKLQTCDNKVVVIDGKEYILKLKD